MTQKTIYIGGVEEIVVPATQSIAISNFGGGIASIYYQIVTANYPPAYQLQQTLNNSSVVLGAFADGMTVKIEAGRSIVRYDVGASPDTGIGDADTLGGFPPSYYATYGDTVSFKGNIGDVEDLDNYVENGIYIQASSSQAGNGSNYPVAFAGTLIVLGNENFITQIYTPRNAEGIFFRAAFSGTFSPWADMSNNIDATPRADQTATGISAQGKTIDSNATGFGAALFLAADGNYDEANATDSSLMPCSAIALEAGTGSLRVLKEGYVRNDAWNWTPGGLVYVSTTSGVMTQTAPSISGNVVQIVGTAESADIIYFDPELATQIVP